MTFTQKKQLTEMYGHYRNSLKRIFIACDGLVRRS